MGDYHPGTIGIAQQRERRFAKYGITTADYSRMRDAQHNSCAICGWHADSAWDLVVDHDHGNGRVRGLLCGPCNKAIGTMRDDAQRLRAAADYLDQTNSLPKTRHGKPLSVTLPKRCTKCGFSRKPEQLRGGLCRRCKRKTRAHFLATAEQVDAEKLDAEFCAAGEYWEADMHLNTLAAWRKREHAEKTKAELPHRHGDL